MSLSQSKAPSNSDMSALTVMSFCKSVWGTLTSVPATLIMSTVWCLCDVCQSLSCCLSVSQSKATHVCFSNSNVCVHSLSCLSVSQSKAHSHLFQQQQCMCALTVLSSFYQFKAHPHLLQQEKHNISATLSAHLFFCLLFFLCFFLLWCRFLGKGDIFESVESMYVYRCYWLWPCLFLENACAKTR